MLDTLSVHRGKVCPIKSEGKFTLSQVFKGLEKKPVSLYTNIIYGFFVYIKYISTILYKG